MITDIKVIRKNKIRIVSLRVFFFLLLFCLMYYQFNNTIYLLYFIYLVAFIFLILVALDVAKRGGSSIEVYEGYLLYKAKGVKVKYDLLFIKNIDILYSSFSGNFRPMSMRLDTGLGNKISIQMENNLIQYDVKFTLNNLKELNKLIPEWKTRYGLFVGIKDEWGGEDLYKFPV